MFRHRSHQPELLDQPEIPFADIWQNMRELDTINTLLGGHQITLQGIKAVLRNHRLGAPVKVLEIGCGDGNNLRVVKNWGTKHGIPMELTGIDYNEACISYAQQLESNTGISFICSDYRSAVLAEKPDIIFSSLFCHHFKDAALVEQLQWMQQHAAIGFFINDLHRHPLAYHSIKLLTSVFSKSYLVKNDAPLSVLRGFSRKEWNRLIAESGITRAQCRWKWAFRWLIVCAA